MGNVSEKLIYRFGDVEVDTLHGCVRCGGDERHLRKQTFQVLIYLLEQRRHLITKQELMDEIWKDIAVTDDVLVQCIKEIRRVIGDDSHHPRFIKTVPKAGYRFIGTVESGMRNAKREIQDNSFAADSDRRATNEISAPPNDERQTNSALRIPPSAFERHPVLIAILVLVAAFALLGFIGQSLWQDGRQSAETALPDMPGKKSLAVMFFENQSNSPELEWLREGLADMLITNLARSPKLTVLSRGQLHLLLERIGSTGNEISLDKTLEIGRKSRAMAVVVGSFARLGDKIRLDVQLFDTKNGSLLASESLVADKPEQILTEIDLLSLKLEKQLGANPNEQEKTANITAVMTDNLEAYRCYSLAVEKAQALHNKDAIALLEKAVVMDSQFAMAHARIGYIYAISWGLADKAKPHLEKAFQMSDRLTEKDRLNIAAWYAVANLDFANAIQSFRKIIAAYPTETEAYLLLGNLLKGEERVDEAIDTFKQGLTIDPDSPLLYNALGLIYSNLGRHDEALAMHRRFVELAPNEANAHDSLGMSYQWAGFYAEAIAEYNRALELNPNFEIALIHLGNARFQTGRYREAIDLYLKYIEIAPSEFERARGYNCIARVYLAKKNLAAAEQAANQAARQTKTHGWESLVIALERSDQTAAERLEIEVFAESPYNNRGNRIFQRYGFYFRGYIALKRGQSAAALENFKEAIRHLPPTYDIDSFEDSLADAFLNLGQVDEAVSEYKRILSLNPNYPLAHFHLAQAFEQKGLSDDARESYRQFLEVWKNADADIPEVLFAKNFVGNL